MHKMVAEWMCYENVRVFISIVVTELVHRGDLRHSMQPE